MRWRRSGPSCSALRARTTERGPSCRKISARNALTVKAVRRVLLSGIGPKNAIDQNLVNHGVPMVMGNGSSSTSARYSLSNAFSLIGLPARNARNVLRSLLRTMVGIGKPSSMVPVAVVLQAPACNVPPFRPRYVRITGHGNTANLWNSMEEALFLRK